MVLVLVSLTSRYSVLDMTSLGIPRIDRYERAIRHDLDPPTRVLELINLYPNDRQVTHW